MCNITAHAPPLSQSNLNPSPPSKCKPHRPPKLPPLAKRIPRPLTLYNETLIDYYHWMHYIDQDPDVATYIQAESEYTAAWVAQSGIENLQKQLDREVNQITTSMTRAPKRGNSLPSDSLVDSNNAINSPSSSRSEMAKPNVEYLERTQFWDVDRWRYWLDTTVGDYGVYKRRPIPSDAYHQAMEDARHMYMSHSAASKMDLGQKMGALSQSKTSQTPFVVQSKPEKDRKENDGTMSTNKDVNRLARREKRKGRAGQFSFGDIEIQPYHTSLSKIHGTKMNSRISGGEGTETETLVAFTYDVSGDERYHIRIMPLPSSTAIEPTPISLPSTLSALKLASECERQPSPAGFDFDNWCEVVDQGCSIITLEGNVLKDAGPETRWVKLGHELYLYFTRLDSKGLQREVWRVKVDSLNITESNPRLNLDQHGKDKPKTKLKPFSRLIPEMVMREDNEENSSGQTNSRTYFLSIDSPETGWHLVRQAEENVIYKVEHHSGYFYLRTNHDNAPNFKVLRIPVEYYLRDAPETFVKTPAVFSRVGNKPTMPIQPLFLRSVQDEVVIEHSPNELIERLEVFVEHFVAWIWRGGLQEFRIFLAPHSGDSNPEFPLKELQRVRPYNPDLKIATVMPGTIHDEEDRLFREFYSTRFRYSNCSFIHPWALYELNMDDLIPLMETSNTGENEERITAATKLICQDPFPIGVRYGKSQQEPLQDVDISPKDPEKEQEQEMSRYKEMRIMVPSTHPHNQSEGSDSEKTMIPISVVYYTYPDGDRLPRPSGFLNAYGAYGTMTSPSFDPEFILPLLRRGLIYVQVHPRGDGVLGPSWYADGKLENKRNTFYDVEDVLLYLRNSGMVEAGGVVVQGRSAGGLITGWIANRWGEASQLPPGSSIGEEDDPSTEKGKSKNIVREMVKVVLAQVPFLDVITDMSDPNIPWVEYEWSEWGSPLQSREIFEVMKAYSPYDRIRNQPYPAMMVMGGLTDERVSYAEPLKYVAKLRSIDGKTNDCQSVKEKQHGGKKKMCVGEKETPLLLEMEDGGHFSGRRTLWMAFALHHLGADKCEINPYLD
ncbi:hypothetical protein FBU30_003769 [Linnemannia zychae]|nr:hypothetical protein FBU30_003769 [Linnemannia zychae]